MFRSDFAVETLEGRSLLSTVRVVPAPTGDIAVVSGTSRNDFVQIGEFIRDGSVINFISARSPGGRDGGKLDNGVTVLPSSVRFVLVTGEGGDDMIVNASHLDSALYGGPGNDFILTANPGFDDLRGDSGVDTLVSFDNGPIEDYDYVVEEPDYPGDNGPITFLGDVPIIRGTERPDVVLITDSPDYPDLVDISIGIAHYINLRRDQTVILVLDTDDVIENMTEGFVPIVV